MRNQLGLFVCNKGLLRVHVFVSGLVLMLGGSTLVGCPLRRWPHNSILVDHGPIELVTVRSIIRRINLNELLIGFLHQIDRLSLGVKEPLLLDGQRVVVVRKDVLLLFIQTCLDSGLLFIGVTSGRGLDRRMAHLGVVGRHTVTSIIHIYF